MDDDKEYWLLQVWSDRAKYEFWDCSVWARRRGDAKGVASFVDATPRLSWMSDKTLAEAWEYLQEQKRLGRLQFSMTQENERLYNDLFTRPPHRQDSFPQPSAPLKSRSGRSQQGGEGSRGRRNLSLPKPSTT